MHSIETLNIIGHRNEVLRSTFFRQKDEALHIAVIFPGFWLYRPYACMYYPGRFTSAIRSQCSVSRIQLLPAAGLQVRA